MEKTQVNKAMLLVICASAFLTSSCSFSVTPVWNEKPPTSADANATPVKITDKDHLKPKALEQAAKIQRLIRERKFEEAYMMIDDNSPLKLPKDQALANMQEIVDTLGNSRRAS